MVGVRVVDRYTLDREVGRGACGAVWAAQDDVLLRPVAIKRVGPPPGGAGSEAVRAEREARLAAQINHPHVISVFDLVEYDDHFWLVMEYVDGDPLSRLISDRGPQSSDQARRLLAPVADALAAAHDLGIVHRDVKPSNILVGRDGTVKLSDFGIARGAHDATLTVTNSITGSPAYLAPEVATGGRATPASDVWAFGATLFHTLAGHPPYHQEDADNAVLAVLYRVVNDEPPRLPGAGPLAALLERTLTRDPADRMTMAEVRDYLQHVDQTAATSTQALPAPPPPPPAHRAPAAPGRSWALPIAAAAAVVLLLVGLALLVRGGGDEKPVAAVTTSDAPSTGSGGSGSPAPDPPDEPTAAELREFASTYVATADADPAAGFRMLTPDYQQRSPGYREFWGPMSNPRILDLSADPAAMTVTYTYRYDLPGVGNRTETVTLELVERDGRLLIADAS